jgi:hypothetical protein
MTVVPASQPVNTSQPSTMSSSNGNIFSTSAGQHMTLPSDNSTLNTEMMTEDVRQFELSYNEALTRILTVYHGQDAEFNREDLDELISVWQSGMTRKFSIIGDNIDLLVKTKQMAKDKQNKDIHWFLMYAIFDEIYDSTLSDKPKKSFDDLTPSDCIPTEGEQTQLLDFLTILWSRIIVKTIPEFQQLQGSVVWHIPHDFMEEMKKKSEVEPLGLLFNSENTEMVEIMSTLMRKYVPTEPVQNEDGHWSYRVLLRVFFGGDWLTVERALGAQRKRIDGDTMHEMLAGLIPKNEDWHAFRISFQRTMGILMNSDSGGQEGTMYHLANVLHNSNLKLDPLNDYQRVKHSFISLLHGFVTAASLEHIGAESQADAAGFIPEAVLNDSRMAQCEWLFKLIRPMVTKYCQLGCTTLPERREQLINEERVPFPCRFEGCNRQYVYEKCRKKHELKIHGLVIPDIVVNREEVTCEDDGDGVYNYGSTLITLGLMLLNCDDAIREGDGSRIIDMYKWWLLIWKKQESTKYSLASLLIQVQVLCMLSEQDAHRLIWNRTVNRKGGKGKRVAMDFHMENMVKAMKQSLQHLGVNINEKTAQVEARALKGMVDLIDSHNLDLGITKPSGYHKQKHSPDDIKTIVTVLMDKEMFNKQPGRIYDSFPKMNKPLLADLNVKKLKDWMQGHFKQWRYEHQKLERVPY